MQQRDSQKDLDKAIEYLNELFEKAYTWTRPIVTKSTIGSDQLESII